MTQRPDTINRLFQAMDRLVRRWRHRLRYRPEEHYLRGKPSGWQPRDVPRG